MSEFFSSKEAGDESDDTSSSDSFSQSQDSWDINVPDLLCQEKSVEEPPLETQKTPEPSPVQDMDIKGIVSRKGKTPSRSRQRASTIKMGRGKGGDSHSKKDLEKIEEKEDILAAEPGNKDEPPELGAAEPEEDDKNNNNLMQAPSVLEREVEGRASSDTENHA